MLRKTIATKVSYVFDYMRPSAIIDNRWCNLYGKEFRKWQAVISISTVTSDAILVINLWNVNNVFLSNVTETERTKIYPFQAVSAWDMCQEGTLWSRVSS